MTFTIKHRHTREGLWTCEADSLKEAVEAAVKAGADLCCADLYCADLYCADLYCADFTGAILGGAILRGADFTGANLCGAILRGADFTGAILGGAILRGADFTGANLCGAILRGADFTGANSIVSFGPCPGTGRIGYVVAHPGGPMVQLGCFWGPQDEAKARVATKYGDTMAGAAYAALIDAACFALATREVTL